jgi:hypothetical protein
MAGKPVRVVKFGAGGPHEVLGLQHIDSVTQSGERSCMDWYKLDLLPEVPEEKDNRRVHGELKFLCFLIDLMLRDKELVESAISGQSSVLDVVGRRSLLLHGILTGTVQWSEGERLLPAGALKSSTIEPGLGKRLAKILKPEAKGAGKGGKPIDP